MLPESPRVASSITMGVSWGIGGGIVSGIIDLCERWQSYDAAFAGFAVAATLSSVLCVALPSPAAHRSAQA
jgi:FSR family fosmidomycin resistance protein-like MFS transporter